MAYKILLTFIFFFFLNLNILADDNIDQWKDSNKTYYDLIQGGYQVKSYDITNIKIQNDYIFIFFVTVLQKGKSVFECQEYQTLDSNLQTLDLNFVCRELVKPYKKGMGT